MNIYADESVHHRRLVQQQRTTGDFERRHDICSGGGQQVLAQRDRSAHRVVSDEYHINEDHQPLADTDIDVYTATAVVHVHITRQTDRVHGAPSSFQPQQSQ